MKKVLIGVVVLVFVIGGLYLFSSNKITTPSDMLETTKLNTPETTKKEVTEFSKEESSEVSIENNPNTKIADLIDVSGGDSSGMGYVLRENGQIKHYIYAELPTLTGDDEYEGWLVKQSPTLTFFSTGVMQETGEGIFELVYMNDEQGIDHDFVVITKETIVDETPEVHILEGAAKQRAK